MNQIESIWKLVIELDVRMIEISTTLGLRKKYRRMLQKTYRKCIQQTCQNIMKIIQKDEAKLTLQLTHLIALYKTSSSRRGLINAIGTISKTLFGIMDADDTRTVNKQLDLLRNNRKTITL